MTNEFKDSRDDLAKDMFRILVEEGISTLLSKEERKNTPLLFYHTAGVRGLNEN